MDRTNDTPQVPVRETLLQGLSRAQQANPFPSFDALRQVLPDADDIIITCLYWIWVDENSTQCRNEGCPNVKFFTTFTGGKRHTWHLCGRCLNLRRAHSMSLTDLVALWIMQDGKCFCCKESLDDPRTPGITDYRRWAHLDHDHAVHAQKNHSCPECRRGLACAWCNQNGVLSKRPRQRRVLQEVAA